MSWKLYMKQRGNGCDYMIGCGQTVEDLRAKEQGNATAEAIRRIKERTHSECTIEKAYLFQVTEDLSYVGQEAAQERYDRIAKAELEEKKAQLKRLKEELGEK